MILEIEINLGISKYVSVEILFFFFFDVISNFMYTLISETKIDYDRYYRFTLLFNTLTINKIASKLNCSQFEK